MAKVNLAELDMRALIAAVLPFRTEKYIEEFLEKMETEGITSPADLLKASKEALETKLSTHASFNYIQMADAVSLRESIDPTRKNRASSSRSQQRSRSRSPRRRMKGSDREHRGSSCNNSRQGGRHNHGGRRSRAGNKHEDKPELWAACERGDAEAAEQLLIQGKDIEE